MRTMALMLLCDHRAIDGAREAQLLNFGRDRCLPHDALLTTHDCLVSYWANNH